MKKLSKLLCFIIVFITLMSAFCTVSFAATVWQPLTDPESGWQRIDDSDIRFSYSGTWLVASSASWYNNSTKYNYSTDSSKSIKFKFKGTKLRIIQTQNASTGTNNLRIDGVEYEPINCYITSGALYRILTFQKLDLSDSIHTVELYGGSSDKFNFDAIDIDESGYLVDTNSPSNLSAQPGDAKVDLKWDAAEGATSYNVKRSLTPGGSYETITTTSSITYPDTGLKNGTTYYYVVTTIVNGVESSPSNEASATPTAPVITSNPGILEITMNNGQIKEYDLSGSEIQQFLTWYDGRSNGADKAYYMITKKNNIKPFLSRKEYISFDKISSFEVKEYTE